MRAPIQLQVSNTTAPNRKSVIKKSIITTGTWGHLIIMKYLLAVPVYRYCQALKPTGFELSPGTVENGLKKIRGLLQPVYNVNKLLNHPSQYSSVLKLNYSSALLTSFTECSPYLSHFSQTNLYSVFNLYLFTFRHINIEPNCKCIKLFIRMVVAYYGPVSIQWFYNTYYDVIFLMIS